MRASPPACHPRVVSGPGSTVNHEQQHAAPGRLGIKDAASLLAPRPGVATPDTGTVAPEGIVEQRHRARDLIAAFVAFGRRRS